MDKDFTTCAKCGMLVMPREYHPYTACVIFRQVRQSDKVQAMLRQVAEYGYRAAEQGVGLDTALRDLTTIKS